MSLIGKVRTACSVDENDDFFRTEAILQYLNAAKDKVVSELIRKETEVNGRAIRGLDMLRKVHTTYPVTEVVSIPAGTTYVEEEIDLTTGAQAIVDGSNNSLIKELLYLNLQNTNGNVQLKELTSNDRFQLNWGTIRPTDYQSFYYITGDAKLMLYKGVVGGGTTLGVHYIAKPSVITVDTDLTGLDDLPLQLHNAVIYAACEMMAIQEKRANTQNFAQLYEEEIVLNAY
jgi:hypothetical protein